MSVIFTVWPGFEEPCGIRGRVSSTCRKVLRCSQWARLPIAVCSENVYSWFDPLVRKSCFSMLPMAI